MKKRYLISILCFLIPIVLLLGFSLFDRDQHFSEDENRELATAPSITVAGYADASFMQKFETYFNDQFPFRKMFLALSKKYNSILYPNLLISEEDVITLPSAPPVQNGVSDVEITSGSMIYKNRIMETFRVSDINTVRFANVVNRLYQECGAPETYVLLPKPAYNLYAPHEYTTDEFSFDHAWELTASTLNGPKLLDLRPLYDDLKNEYIYFRSDHHWTATGAYYACNAFLETVENVSLPPLETYKSGVREGFLGSLYKSAKNNQVISLIEKTPDRVEYFYPFAEAKVTSYKTAAMTDPEERDVIYADYEKNDNLYAIFMGGDIPLARIDTGTKNGKSIMVVRDSYGHAFAPFLIDAYETIWLLEPRYFNESANKFELGTFFKEQRIDKLLFLGYPPMTVGVYWDTISNHLEQLVVDKK